MKNLAFLAVLACGAVHAADIPADADCAAPALPLLLAELPLDVQRLLGRGVDGIGGLADSHERFTATDAIGPPYAPMTRFRWAGQGKDCYAVTLERGGFARHIETAVLRHVDGAWRLIGMRAPRAEEIGAPYLPAGGGTDDIDVSALRWPAAQGPAPGK